MIRNALDRDKTLNHDYASNILTITPRGIHSSAALQMIRCLDLEMRTGANAAATTVDWHVLVGTPSEMYKYAANFRRSRSSPSQCWSFLEWMRSSRTTSLRTSFSVSRPCPRNLNLKWQCLPTVYLLLC